MLIVAVLYEFVPDGFDRIKKEIMGAIENSRKEPGAQIYDWTIDVTSPNRATIFEMWSRCGATRPRSTRASPAPIWTRSWPR